MDYSYLNQAAANFDATAACSLSTTAMDPTGLGSCTYGDLASCSQMSAQAAYRYTAASMARSYNHTANTAASMGHSLGNSMSQCGSIMGARNHQDHQRPSMFPSMNLQGTSCFRSINLTRGGNLASRKARLIVVKKADSLLPDGGKLTKSFSIRSCTRKIETSIRRVRLLNACLQTFCLSVFLLSNR